MGAPTLLFQTVTLCIVAVVPFTSGGHFLVERSWSIHCPKIAHLGHFDNEFHSSAQDRSWHIECVRLSGGAETTSKCETFDVNRFGESFEFMCPLHFVLTSMSSTYSSQHKDRTFNLTCCQYPSPLFNPLFTGYRNNFSQPMEYFVPSTKVVVGMQSIRSHAARDRRYGFIVSDIEQTPM